MEKEMEFLNEEMIEKITSAYEYTIDKKAKETCEKFTHRDAEEWEIYERASGELKEFITLESLKQDMNSYIKCGFCTVVQELIYADYNLFLQIDSSILKKIFMDYITWSKYIGDKLDDGYDGNHYAELYNAVKKEIDDENLAEFIANAIRNGVGCNFFEMNKYYHVIRKIETYTFNMIIHWELEKLK